MTEVKHIVTDSVFTYLLRQPEYMLELYHCLYPEDADVKPDEFKLVTLENVLAVWQYNDLGFQVRDRLVVLVEAQSTFSENLSLRMFLYPAVPYRITSRSISCRCTSPRG